MMKRIVICMLWSMALAAEEETTPRKLAKAVVPKEAVHHPNNNLARTLVGLAKEQEETAADAAAADQGQRKLPKNVKGSKSSKSYNNSGGSSKATKNKPKEAHKTSHAKPQPPKQAPKAPKTSRVKPQPKPVHKPQPVPNPVLPPPPATVTESVSCFDTSAQAGALGSFFLASMWYEITAVPNCETSGIHAVLDKFFTVDATLQDSNAQLIAINRDGLKQALLPYIQGLCQNSNTNNAFVSWTLKTVNVELPAIKDDLVWGGNLETSSGGGESNGFYIMIQLGGQRGGYTLQGYDATKRATPLALAQECYQPIIYSMVQLDAFDNVPML